MTPPTSPTLVCHVLLLETDNGLVLVDTGFGTHDCIEPARRVGPTRHLIRPALDRNEAAIHQIERLGFARDDVCHIVLTHFDVDHIGGLSDFPAAQVHVTNAEVLGAMRPPTRRERMRFRPRQWAHGPKLVEHDPGGEQWRGFAAAKELTEVAPGIAMISLPGHTRRHACIAVDAGNRWILHCGDAFCQHATLTGERVPFGLNAFDKLFAFDRKQARANKARLVELYQHAEPDLFMVCAHDKALFDQACATA